MEGEWQEASPCQFELRLGRAYRATVRRRGGSGIFANCWMATLNGEHLVETNDLAFAKGRVEYQIVIEMRTLADAYRRVRDRAPASTDLFPDGAWMRWKAASAARSPSHDGQLSSPPCATSTA